VAGTDDASTRGSCASLGDEKVLEEGVWEYEEAEDAEGDSSEALLLPPMWRALEEEPKLASGAVNSVVAMGLGLEEGPGMK